MPRLLSLNSYHYRRGGSDVVYFEHDALLRSEGWGTAVMAMHHPRNEPSEWSEFFVDELEFGHAYGLLQKAAMAAKVIYSLEARRRLGALLARFRPDIAHAHCIYHHLSPSVLGLLRSEGIPVVMTAHDLKLACPAYKMLNRHGICERCKGGNLLHLIGNRCIRDSLPVSGLVAIESAAHKAFGIYRRNLDRIIAPSRFYEQKLIEWGWAAERIRYVPNYVDVRKFAACFSPGEYFLYFGRLAPEKGIATLIRAATAARVKLRVAGTGPMERELKTLAAGGAVEFLGHCGGEALWAQVKGARAIVLPSEWYENAPMSVLEAYASGKPVIGARIGGISELVVDGVTGELFQSGDADGLARQLSSFAAAKPGTISEMGEAARGHVERHFTVERYLAGIRDVYRELGVAWSPGGPRTSAME